MHNSYARATGEPVRLWTTEGQPLATFDEEGGAVSSMAVSADGQLVLTASGKAARLWGAAGQLRATLEHATGAIRLVSVDPQGQSVLTAGDDAVPILWDLQGQPIAKLSGHTDAIEHAAFSPTGNYIITTARDGTALLWSREGRKLQTYQFGGDNRLTTLNAQFSPGDEQILIWQESRFGIRDEQKANLWGLDGTVIANLSGLAGIIRSAEFSLDGRYFLTNSTDNVVRLWSASGKLLISIEADSVMQALFDNGLLSPDLLDAAPTLVQATFDRDGHHILVRTSGQIVKRYVYTLPDMLATAACRVGRGLTEQELDDFGFVDSRRLDFAARQCPPALTPSP